MPKVTKVSENTHNNIFPHMDIAVLSDTELSDAQKAGMLIYSSIYRKEYKKSHRQKDMFCRHYKAHFKGFAAFLNTLKSLHNNDKILSK